jgi:hypothetical protein
MISEDTLKIQKALWFKPVELLRDFHKTFPAPTYVDRFGEWENWAIRITAAYSYYMVSYYISMTSGPYDASFRDFWNRWERFNRLKVFL